LAPWWVLEAQIMWTGLESRREYPRVIQRARQKLQSLFRQNLRKYSHIHCEQFPTANKNPKGFSLFIELSLPLLIRKWWSHCRRA
jgi:hypothetical protein